MNLNLTYSSKKKSISEKEREESHFKAHCVKQVQSGGRECGGGGGVPFLPLSIWQTLPCSQFCLKMSGADVGLPALGSESALENPLMLFLDGLLPL